MDLIPKRSRELLRSQLFSSPGSAIASVVALALGVGLTVVLLQWLVLDAYWVGSDPSACPDKRAACWPFILTRLDQFFYGFYPRDARWRIDLGLALIFLPVVLSMMRIRRIRGPWLISLGVAALAVALLLFRGGWAGMPRVPTDRWGGAFLTIVTVATVFMAALPAGIALALGRRSSLPLVRTLCATWIEFWRGVPALVVLFVAIIMFPLFMPAGVASDKLLRALIAMAILMSCYLAEAVRGALASVPQGQLEAAHALGLGYWRTTFMVVLPQALPAALPQITSNLIGLFKETTVLLIIGVPDLLAMVQAAASDPAWLSEGVLMTGYLFAAAVFWICCFGLSRYSRHLERRLTAHRGEHA